MATLQNIPIELLKQIMICVANEPYQAASFMCSLSTVCRKFYLVLRPIIYNKVSIYMESGSPASILVLRSLKENCGLVEMVHDMSIGWRRADDTTHDNANALLAALLHLKTLSIQAEWDDICFRPQFLHTNPLSKLKTVKLHDRNLTPDDMRRYMLLEQVEHMTISCLFLGDIPKPTHLESKNSQLSSLDLDSHYHIPAESLLFFLRLCPKLKRLRCALPGKGVPSEWEGAHEEVTTPPSPARLSQALVPVQNTLEVLELEVGSGEWPRHDNSRLDLSMMTALQHLVCPAQCFFVSRTPYSSRAGLYKLLPASLEKFTIRFEYGHGLEDWSRKINTHEKENSQQADAEFLWISELASNKLNYTPHLKTLHFQEPDIRAFDDDDVRMDRWYPPPSVAEILDEAKFDVAAVVSLRPPV